jgi:hypothetical protein
MHLIETTRLKKSPLSATRGQQSGSQVLYRIVKYRHLELQLQYLLETEETFI